ncbi:MAG: potassium/proton antiporter [Fimbriimonadaceae bacterium]
MSHGNTPSIAILLGALFLLACVVASKLSSRLGVPALVLFVGLGMLAGSEGPGGIEFADFELTKRIGMILLGFILFAGGMDTDWKHLKPVFWRGLSLSTVGVVCTTAMIGGFARYVLGLSLIEGLLLGAIVSSTDAAAIFSSLRAKGLNLKDQLAPIVEVESGTNDPIAVMLTAGLTELAINPDTSILKSLPSLIIQMPIGVLVGVLIGKATVILINRIRLEYDGLYPVLTIAAASATLGLSPLVGGNEFIAVYACGVVLGSNTFVHKMSLTQFHDGIAWLLQIVVFLSLGLLVFPSQVLPTMAAGTAFAAFLIFLARPVAVLASLSFAKMTLASKAFVAWAGLRGAFPIILGTFPILVGLESGHFIFNLVFFVVMVSVLIQGTTLRYVAGLLGVVSVPSGQTDLQEVTNSELLEVSIAHDSPSLGKQVVELGLPNTALVVLLRRGRENYIPRGSTVLRAGDTLVVATRKEDDAELKLLLLGPPKA